MSSTSIILSASRREYNTKLFSRDLFVELIKDQFLEAFFAAERPANYADKCKYIEELVEEHLANPEGSRLTSSVPTISLFHTPLKFAEAFDLIDREHNISKRTHIPPSFQEIKDALNFSQALATGRTLALATFDGDGTLYNDGDNFGEYPEIGNYMVQLMQAGVIISVVTAAVYMGAYGQMVGSALVVLGTGISSSMHSKFLLLLLKLQDKVGRFSLILTRGVDVALSLLADMSGWGRRRSNGKFILCYRHI